MTSLSHGVASDEKSSVGIPILQFDRGIPILPFNPTPVPLHIEGGIPSLPPSLPSQKDGKEVKDWLGNVVALPPSQKDGKGWSGEIPPLPLPSAQKEVKGWSSGGIPPSSLSAKDHEDVIEEKDEPLGDVTEIVARAYDIKIKDDFKGSESTEIHLWTMDNKSDVKLLRVRDFPVFCHIELPQFVDGRIAKWDEDSGQRIVSWLKEALNRDGNNHGPIGGRFDMKPKIYYYRQQRKFPMLLLLFKSIRAMDHCRNLINKPRRIPGIGEVKMEMWEDRISVVRKMFSLREMRYAQWFKVKGQEVPLNNDQRVSIEGSPGYYGLPPSLIKEYIIDWNTLEGLKPEQCKGWMTRPRILSFDIETYSDNHRAMPNEFNAKHKAFMISCIYKQMGDKSSLRKFGIIIGDCADIPGVDLIKVKNEIELVQAMADLITKLNPQVMTGYNIFSYDYPYLDVRLKTKMRDWPSMGCLEGVPSTMSSKSWKSSAYGYNKINILEMDGRISIDMLPIVRRDYKLDKYDLDTVGKFFLKKGKHDMKAADMFRIYELYESASQRHQELQQALEACKLHGINVAAIEAEIQSVVKFIQKVCELKAKLVSAAQNKVVEAQAKVDACASMKLDAVEAGVVSKQAQDDLDKAKKEMARFMDYCINDGILPIELFEKLMTWIGLGELSSIVGVTIMELFTRGQQIRCQSQLYDLASKKGYVIDKRIMAKMFFNGGFVFEPKPGIYDNIICLDFASLYPSIMEAYNICFTTLVPPELADQVPDSDCNVIEFDQEETPSGKPKVRGDSKDEEDEGVIEGVNDEESGEGDVNEDDSKDAKAKPKTVKRHYRFKFVKPSVRMGILPCLVHDLVAERNAVRKQMKPLKSKIDEYEGVGKMVDTYKNQDVKTDVVTTKLTEDIKNTEGKLMELKSREVKGDEIKPLKAAIDKAVATIKALNDAVTYLKTFEPSIALNTILRALDEALFDVNTQYNTLNCRQLALKVSANSMFGFLGAQNGGIMPLIEGAMCITAIGRMLIGKVNEYLITKYGASIVYNDTDSSMVDLHIKDSKDCEKWGIRLMNEISGTPEERDKDGKVIKEAVHGLFMSPLRIEFEKAMRLLCLKKKKYAAYLIEKDGSFQVDRDTGEKVVMKKGIVLARRDNCAYLRTTYMSLLRSTLDRDPFEKTYKVLTTQLTKLLRGQIVAKGNLTIIRELGANYKNSNYFMKVFSDELRRMGKPVNPGDRLEYVVVKTKEEMAGYKVALGKKMRAIEIYEEALEAAKRPPPPPPPPLPPPQLEVKEVKRSRFIASTDPLPIPTTRADIRGSGKSLEVIGKPEQIDYLYYIEHTLMNAIDQLLGVGYMTELAKYTTIGFTPQNSRCHFCSIQLPVKMIGKLITDELRGLECYGNPESEKLTRIADSIDQLPQWFINKKAEMAAAEAPVRRSRFVSS